MEGAVGALAAAGCETAHLDAELLLAHATGWDRAEIAADPDLRLPVGASREFAAMVRRRVRREPVAYILGRKGFRRIELIVDRRVLIPRPETELLVEVAVEAAPRAVLDVGTGSGAIALAVADELPGARIVATDTSMDALRVAEANADRLGLADSISWSPTSRMSARRSGRASPPRSASTSRGRPWSRARRASRRSRRCSRRSPVSMRGPERWPSRSARARRPPSPRRSGGPATPR